MDRYWRCGHCNNKRTLKCPKTGRGATRYPIRHLKNCHFIDLKADHQALSLQPTSWRVPHGRAPHRGHLMGVYLINVYLTGVHLMGVYLINVHLTGVHLIDVYFMDAYMFPNPKRLWRKPLEPPPCKRWFISSFSVSCREHDLPKYKVERSMSNFLVIVIRKDGTLQNFCCKRTL